tara:strand:- start:725 stop:895 length:171 start_codon:yes stop_codon:yes gene_type:complete
MNNKKNKRKFLKYLFVIGVISSLPISLFLSKKKHSLKKLAFKKQFSKIWLLEINDS